MKEPIKNDGDEPLDEEKGANMMELQPEINQFYDSACTSTNMQPLLQQPGGALACYRASAASILTRSLPPMEASLDTERASAWEELVGQCWQAEALYSGACFRIGERFFVSAGFVKYTVISWPLQEVADSYFVLSHKQACKGTLHYHSNYHCQSCLILNRHTVAESTARRNSLK
jgi:hypothetical protein